MPMTFKTINKRSKDKKNPKIRSKNGLKKTLIEYYIIKTCFIF